jgi:hypothetical protein
MRLAIEIARLGYHLAWLVVVILREFRYWMAVAARRFPWRGPATDVPIELDHPPRWVAAGSAARTFVTDRRSDRSMRSESP